MLRQTSQIEHAAADTLPDDLSDVLRVMAVTQQICDGSFHCRRREAIYQGHVSLAQIASMQANPPASLLAVCERDLRYVIEKITELVQACGRCVRYGAGPDGIGETFLGCLGRVESEPSSPQG